MGMLSGLPDPRLYMLNSHSCCVVWELINVMNPGHEKDEIWVQLRIRGVGIQESRQR